MMICIDGDNAPGANIAGINKLTEDDSVIVFYAANNKYYCLEQNRNKFKDTAKCNIEFRIIPAGDCSVDIAIAMYTAQAVLQLEPQIMVLISDDKHIGIIASQAQNTAKNWLIVQETSIEEAAWKYRLPEKGNLSELYKFLIKQYGDKAGADLYRKLGDQFKQQERRRVGENRIVRIKDAIKAKIPIATSK